MTKRPVALSVLHDAIPDVLKREARWVPWRYKLHKGRWTKPPVGNAKVDTPSTWMSFERVCDYGGYSDGIGFVLGDGWGGCDLDHCRDVKTGNVDPAAQHLLDVLKELGCYLEVSPSGTGFKAIFRSKLIGFEIDYSKDCHVTPWTRARYFTITGHGEGDPTVDGTMLVKHWVPKSDSPNPITPTSGFKPATDWSDHDLLLQIASSKKQGQLFLRLWQGGRGPAGPLTEYKSHSEADLALCSILAYWTDYDRERIDRLFRRSGLMRDKWASGSYREATLARACIRRVA